MKTRRFKVYKYTYTIDFPVIFLFFGVFLDIISTMLFVVLKAGTESHIILKELFSTNALFIPFLSDILRKALSYTFGLMGLLLALNNFSLVIFRNAFLVDTIGYNPLLIIHVLFGLTLFVYLMKKEKLNNKEIISTCLKLIQFLLCIGLIHSLFVVIIWPAFF